MAFEEYTDLLTATIAVGESESNVVELGGFTTAGIVMPSGWTAGDITFLGSHRPDNTSAPSGTFNPIYSDDGTEIALTVAASRNVGVSGSKADALAPWTYLKVRSGTAALPVAQLAERVIYIVVKI